MCEIAVVDPEQCNITIIHQLADKFYKEQGDGLGVVAVKNRGDKFEYDTYKSTKPHWQTLYAFLRRNRDDTWRYVVHGRNGTSGGVNRESAHPIHVDCEHCEFEWVVHNGSVRNDDNHRAGFTSQGHTFTTEVDSEVLAHAVSELPEDVEDLGYNTTTCRGNLNYLLFSENGILVRARSKYHLTEHFTMTCSLTQFEWDDNDYTDFGFDSAKQNEWMIVTPGEDEPGIEVKEQKYQRTGSSTTTTSSTAGRGYGNWNSGAAGSHPQGKESDIHREEYKDLAPNYEAVVAFYACPDTICVIDQNTGQRDYVRRSLEPRLYYFYADEEPTEEIEVLEERAERLKRAHAKVAQDKELEAGQTKLEDFPEVEEIVDIAATHAAVAVAKRSGNQKDIEELQETQDEVEESIRRNMDALEGTIA